MALDRTTAARDEVVWAIREQIGLVDRQILELVAVRFERVRELWRHKAAVGLPLVDPEREAFLRRRRRMEGVNRGLDPAFVARLFEEVVAEGKRAAARPLVLPGPAAPPLAPPPAAP